MFAGDTRCQELCSYSFKQKEIRKDLDFCCCHFGSLFTVGDPQHAVANNGLLILYVSYSPSKDNL